MTEHSNQPDDKNAGWYKCPHNPNMLRYWNGIKWTHHTNPQPNETNTWENQITNTITNPKIQTIINHTRTIKEIITGIIFIIVGTITTKIGLENTNNQNYLPIALTSIFIFIGIYLIIKNIYTWTQQQ